MAKAEIKMPYIESQSNYFKCEIWYKVKSGFMVTEDSLRIYYSTTSEITSQTPYVAINNDNGSILSKSIKDGWKVILCRVPLSGTTLAANTCYWLRARLELFKTDGTSYKKYRAPKSPTPQYTMSYKQEQELFQIASFTNPHTDGESGETTYDQTWVDFTGYIPAPTYDVNYEDVNEDWEDANYVTHRIVPRSKIKGSLELLFDSQYAYNNFLKLIKNNRAVLGNGYTRLKVQVNNDLDLDSGSGGSLETKRCVTYQGNFFLRMEENPWVAPLFGHFDKYEPVRLEIEEA